MWASSINQPHGAHEEQEEKIPNKTQGGRQQAPQKILNGVTV